MMTHKTMGQSKMIRLSATAQALEAQLRDRKWHDLSFEQRFSLLADAEWGVKGPPTYPAAQEGSLSQYAGACLLSWHDDNAPAGNFLHLRQSSRITLGGEHNSLEKFLSGLSVEKWMKYLSSPDEMEDKITLPRFTFEDDAGFKNVPSALGMEVAFDQERAGFGSMNPVGPGRNLSIEYVKHRSARVPRMRCQTGHLVPTPDQYPCRIRQTDYHGALPQNTVQRQIKP